MKQIVNIDVSKDSPIDNEVLYFAVKPSLAGQKPTNWGQHLYHSEVEGELSHERYHKVSESLRFNVLTPENAKVTSFRY